MNTKSFYGFVGLKNLGCICYMNAMLQQFFMTPTFRYAILMANDNLDPEMVEVKKFGMVDDNPLHQLRRMFGFLEASDRQDYNPSGFCHSFKDWGGNPVNVSIQQDAQEFLNQIFEKLENGLKITPFSRILEGVYGGQKRYTTVCKNCGNVSTRDELFYNVSLQIKNYENIYEALGEYIKMETISDYRCDACTLKVDITRRGSIQKLPNVMIVHLQRLVFDLETL